MIKKTIYIVVSIIWLLLLMWAGYETLSKDEIDAVLIKSGEPVTNRIAKVKSDIVKNCWHHDEMIDLYGLWARCLDQHRCNGEIKFGASYLVGPLGRPNIGAVDEKIVLLLDRLKSSGIPSLYVQCPYKNSIQKSIIPPGAGVDWSNDSANRLLHMLKSQGWKTLDLRPSLVNDMTDLMKNYFKTDHHWNCDGAMKAFPLVTQGILDALGIKRDVSFYTDAGNWKRMKMNRGFLGSEGRRTGALYVGMDEMYYYLPRFETFILRHVYASAPNQEKLRVGPFETSIFQDYILKSPPSHFSDWGYNLYGSDQPLVRYRNNDAPIRKRIMILKDSYALPIVAFMSTIFTSVDMIDLRHFNEMSLADYININRPDLLCMIYNPQAISMGQKFWQFEKKDLNVHKREKLAVNELKQIKESDSDYNYSPIVKNIASGAGYLLSVKELKTNINYRGGVTVGVFNDASGKLVVKREVGCGFGSDNIYLRCPDGDGPFSLVMYAGKAGATKGVSLECLGLTVEKCNW